METILYITHPQVNVDPEIPVPQWGLSETGMARAKAFAARNIFADGTLFVSSEETKARELADCLAQACNGSVTLRAECGENDRSSTGFLPPDRFEAQADRLFAEPGASADGWETANAAQARIVAAVSTALADAPQDRAIAFVGHGCVGTLLKCHLGRRPIARSEDQSRIADPGGGNIFAFASADRRNLASARLLCDWTPMEHWQGA